MEGDYELRNSQKRLRGERFGGQASTSGVKTWFPATLPLNDIEKSSNSCATCRRFLIGFSTSHMCRQMLMGDIPSPSHATEFMVIWEWVSTRISLRIYHLFIIEGHESKGYASILFITFENLKWMTFAIECWKAWTVHKTRKGAQQSWEAVKRIWYQKKLGMEGAHQQLQKSLPFPVNMWLPEMPQ